jgi:hypothetical protein
VFPEFPDSCAQLSLVLAQPSPDLSTQLESCHGRAY